MKRYILRQVFVDNSPGMYGWSDSTGAMSNRERAIAAVDYPMPRGCYIQEAYEIDENGRRTRIARRERPRSSRIAKC
jgi:hypothetical protein